MLASCGAVNKLIGRSKVVYNTQQEGSITSNEIYHQEQWIDTAIVVAEEKLQGSISIEPGWSDSIESEGIKVVIHADSQVHGKTKLRIAATAKAKVVEVKMNQKTTVEKKASENTTTVVAEKTKTAHKEVSRKPKLMARIGAITAIAAMLFLAYKLYKFFKLKSIIKS